MTVDVTKNILRSYTAFRNTYLPHRSNFKIQTKLDEGRQSLTFFNLFLFHVIIIDSPTFNILAVWCSLEFKLYSFIMILRSAIVSEFCRYSFEGNFLLVFI